MTLAGNDSPDPATLGVNDVTLSNGTFTAAVPATLLIAGYNLGLLSVGPNTINAIAYVARQATGAATGVNVQNFTTSATTTITDPDGTPGTGDESATPLNVTLNFADWTVTPTSGGTITWRQADPGSLPSIPGVGAGGSSVTPSGSIFISAQVGPGGLIKANFDCQPGTASVDGSTFTPGAATPFETTTVVAPPAPPVANDDGPGNGPWGNATVGGLESVTLNVLANDTDQNGDIDPSSVTIVTPPTAGTAVANADGTITYTNTDSSETTDTFTYTVDDLAGNGPSNEATVTVNILGNLCTADCSLSQIITLDVIGGAMTLEQAGNLVELNGTLNVGPSGGSCDPTGGIVLNGQPQTACGFLNEMTVTNARGTDAGWSLTGEVTDFTDGTIPGNSCSTDATANNHCIPGDNLGWSPTAEVAHLVIIGDVAQVSPGAEVADPLSAIKFLGATPPGPRTGLGPNAPGGLTLCQSPANHSGGTFTCNAGLVLSVPASAAAGTYTATLTLTLA